MAESALGLTTSFRPQVVDLESPKQTPRESKHWQLPGLVNLSFLNFTRQSPGGSESADLHRLITTCQDVIEESISRLIELTEIIPLSSTVDASHGESSRAKGHKIEIQANATAEKDHEIPFPSLVTRGLVASRFSKLREPLLQRISATIEDRRETLMQKRLDRAPSWSHALQTRSEAERAVEDAILVQHLPNTADNTNQAEGYVEPTAVRPRHSEHPDLYRYPDPPEPRDANTDGILRCDWCFDELWPKDLEMSEWW